MKPTYEELEAKCALQQSKLETINKLMGIVETASDIAKAGVAELEARCAALAAENAALNEAMIVGPDCDTDAVEDEFYDVARYEAGPIEEITGGCCNAREVIQAVLKKLKPETPATDAFLAEVRASGVEMFARSLRGEAEITKVCTFNPVQQFEEFAARADEFAAQLRQGAK